MDPQEANQARMARIAWVSALIAVAGLIAWPLRGHVDDMDAQMYLVVARSLAHDRSWLDPRFLPGWLPQFREHPPFGFWPAVATIRLFGESAVPFTYGLITLAAVAVTGVIARRLGGTWAGVLAILLLGTCESVWRYGARLLLEPLLFLFATAAAGAALSEKWGLAAGLGAIAALIKGPFGLLPLGAVALARLPGWRGLAATGLAAVPLGVFILLDPGGGWREGYWQGRLLAGSAGWRTDGIVLWWFPISVIARRFWPGLPFVLLGIWLAVRNPRLRPLAIGCVMMVAGLCLPRWKWGNHTYAAFPLLAVLAGVSAAELVRPSRRPASFAAVAMGAALVSWGVFASGASFRLLPPPCPFSTSLREPLKTLAPGTKLLLVTPRPDLAALCELAAEFHLEPRPVASLDAPGTEKFALAKTPPAGRWRQLASGQGWFLLRKESATAD